MDIAGAIVAVFTVLGLILQAYYNRKPERDIKEVEEKEQENRNDLEVHNIGAIEQRIDKLLDASEGSDSSKSEPSPVDEERRLRNFLGVSNDK